MIEEPLCPYDKSFIGQKFRVQGLLAQPFIGALLHDLGTRRERCRGPILTPEPFPDFPRTPSRTRSSPSSAISTPAVRAIRRASAAFIASPSSPGARFFPVRFARENLRLLHPHRQYQRISRDWRRRSSRFPCRHRLPYRPQDLQPSACCFLQGRWFHCLSAGSRTTRTVRTMRTQKFVPNLSWAKSGRPPSVARSRAKGYRPRSYNPPPLTYFWMSLR
jgi:hypothetical protein